MAFASVEIHRNSAFKVPLPKKARIESTHPVNVPDRNVRIPTEEKKVPSSAKLIFIGQRMYMCTEHLKSMYICFYINDPFDKIQFKECRLRSSSNSCSCKLINVDMEMLSIFFATETCAISDQGTVFVPGLHPLIKQNINDRFDNLNIIIMSADVGSNESTAETETHKTKIGFYTKKERQERIKKYKLKKAKALASNSSNKIKYANKSNAAMKRLRVNGKFVKA